MDDEAVSSVRCRKGPANVASQLLIATVASLEERRLDTAVRRERGLLRRSAEGRVLSRTDIQVRLYLFLLIICFQNNCITYSCVSVMYA